LDTPLSYDHYGAANPTITSPVGNLDLRAAVGHLSRNIVITRTADPNNWGCRVLVYNFLDGKINRRGFANLYGVEIAFCG
jgi:hypothetical protein